MLHNWIGIPYAVRGNPPESADCWTLVRAYAKQELGLLFPEYMYDIQYNMQAAARHIMREMRALDGNWKKVEHPTIGDLLVYRMAGHPTHCAIYVGAGDLLHTREGHNSCLEPLENWRDNFVGAYRWNA